jgi:predicted DNA-binding transcriptional regulator AlpA
VNRGNDEMEIRLLRGDWLTTDELARVLGVDSSTVRRWRTSRPVQGPPFVQLSERVTMYSAYDVEEWLRSQRIDPREAA